MIKKNIIIIILAVFFITDVGFIQAQNRRFAKRNLKKLCSAEFAGRGYSGNGDKTAANFIVNYLKKYGAKPFKTNSYLQPFEIHVNTFPSKINVKLDNTTLRPQYDYLVTANSNSINGKFPVLYLNAETLNDKSKLQKDSLKNLQNTFLLIDTAGVKNKEFKEAYNYIISANAFRAKGIIKVEHKGLTHVPSQKESDFVVVKIAKQALPKQQIDSIEITVENKYYQNYVTNNIAAYIQGKSDTFIVFSAHYDHLGEMGKGIYFPGANDNGSGVAMLLDLLRYYSKHQEKLKYSIAFLFFSGEELGLLGSFYYVENPIFPLEKIKLLLNLDMVGSGDKGITVVNGSVFRDDFDKIVNLNKQKKYLPKVAIRGAAANSDHFPFYKKGVKSFFIYTMGKYKEYHSIHDNARNIPLSKYKGLFRLLTNYIENI